MQAQYRSFQDFTRQALEAASKGRKKLKLVNDDTYPRNEVIAPLLDDLNTPMFLAQLHTHGISHKLNDIFHLYTDPKPIMVPQAIQDLASQRRQAKQNKDRVMADKLRDELTSA